MPDATRTSRVRSALVTGGTRGIGLGIARALARDGWNLAVCGVRPTGEVTSVIEELRAMGTEAHYVRADIANAQDRARLVGDCLERFAAINALVNNAGRAPQTRADLLDATEDSFEDLMRINLQGPYFLTQAVARHMVDRTRADAAFHGDIVFVTSVSAIMASPNRGEYCVSKAGLSMAARLFAVRLAADGIPVFEVRPGVIATDMTAAVRDTYDRRIAEGLIPANRWGQPADVGQAIASLLRGDVSYATGSVVHVDGGLSIPRL
jgi:3-oxoacyl-[acyl-carrier protein] reductase